MLGAFGGATNGVILMGAILGAEILLPPTRLGHALERAPFLVTLAMKFLVYGTLIVLVVGGRPGGRLVRPVAAMLLSPDLAEAMYVQRAPRAVLMASTFLLLGNAIFVLQMGRLVGERTLRDIVFGRYHRSRTEERFFLFVDIAGSTRLAERIGPDAVHRFLGEVFRLASDPIDDHRGEVLSIRRRRDRDHLDGGRRARLRSTCRLLLRDRTGARAGRTGVRARIWHGTAPPRCAARRPGNYG
jgi:adenylate cyclase